MSAIPPQPPATLAQLLTQQRARAGAAPALLFEGRSWSYGQLDAWSRGAAATAWQVWGVRPGDRVAWLGANHPGMLALLFGLARLGAMLLPLNFRLATAEWERQLTACTPRCVVHDADWVEAAQALAARVAVPAYSVDALSTEAEDAPKQAPESEYGSAQAPVLLVYTSGTTADPRAAVHTQANLLANMAIAAQVQGLTPEDTVLTVLPLFHVGGLCIQTLPALYAGARVILQGRFQPQETLHAIAQQRPTLTLQVPATLQALVAHPQWANTDLSSLRAVWAGSSWLPPQLIAAFHQRGVPVCNVYGATESGPVSIALPPHAARSHVGSCGWPAPGVQVRLGARYGDAAALWLRGPNVAARYWSNPESKRGSHTVPDTAVCDADGWWNSGDLAQQAPDGSYTIVGRTKELIISGGENIHPAEVEQALASHAAVAECAAFGVPDARWGEVVAVAVVLHAGAQATQQDLAAHLQTQLARFKQPRRWVWPSALPKTALGKVQRHRLPLLASED